MRSTLEILLWLLKKGVKSAKDNVSIYVDNIWDAPGDLWGWIKVNKLKFSIIAGGVLVIVFPLAIGFGTAGPIAGTIAAAWQSSIGSVAAGSLFAILQSMAMSGVFMGVGGVLIAGGLFEWAKEGLKRVGGGLGWVWDQLMSGKVLEWFGDSFGGGLVSRDAGALVLMRGGEGEGPDPGAAGALVPIKEEEGREKREGGEEEGEGRKPDPGAAGELAPRGGGGHDGNKSLDELYLSLRVADTKPSSMILIEFRDICLPNGELTIQMAEFKILQEVLAEEGYTPGTYSLTWESSDSCNIAVRTQRGLVTQLRKFLKENQGNKTVPLHCYYYLEVNGTSSAAPDSTFLTPHSF